MSPGDAAAFAGTAIALGSAILALVDGRVFALGLGAVVFYNGLYTLWWKPRWPFAAVPGAIPGALPILMGYAAASGQVLSAGGLYLFFILFFWQMPHFWVLALRYREDYARGGFPTLPVAHGPGVTVAQIVLWCLAYVGLALGAPVFLPVGPLAILTAIGVSVKVLWELRGFVREPESQRWLRFFLWVNFSLILYVFGVVADLWSVHLVPMLTR